MVQAGGAALPELGHQTVALCQMEPQDPPCRAWGAEGTGGVWKATEYSVLRNKSVKSNLCGAEGDEVDQSLSRSQRRAHPSPCSCPIRGVETCRALETAPEPFRVSGALCAISPLFSSPRPPSQGRPSVPCRHQWLLQWGSCQTLPGMIYDAPSAHFELWLLLLFSGI